MLLNKQYTRTILSPLKVSSNDSPRIAVFKSIVCFLLYVGKFPSDPSSTLPNLFYHTTPVYSYHFGLSLECLIDMIYIVVEPTEIFNLAVSTLKK